MKKEEWVKRWRTNILVNQVTTQPPDTMIDTLDILLEAAYNEAQHDHKDK